jgi:hypothetical protein
MAYFLDTELVGTRQWKEGKADYSKWEEEHSKKEYERNFPDNDNFLAVGEKSADYLFWEPCHERIKKYYPDIKVVITLRNPIERAWSMYWNEFGKGRETLSFEDAINKEEERIRTSDYAKVHLSYLSRGNYVKSIRKLLKHIDKNNIHIVILEHSIESPEKSLSNLYSFLEVDTSIGYENVKRTFNKNWTLVQRDLFASNRLLSNLEKLVFKGINLSSSIFFRKNIYKKRQMISFLSKPFRKGKEDHQMSNDTRSKLRSHFAPFNHELEKLLNIKLDWF